MKKMELPAALTKPKEMRSSTMMDSTSYAYSTHLNLSPSMEEGIRCLLPIGEGTIITGGHDKTLRVWDGMDPKSSFPMSGPRPKNPYSDQVRFCSFGSKEQVFRWLVDMIFNTVVILNKALRSWMSVVCLHIFRTWRIQQIRNKTRIQDTWIVLRIWPWPKFQDIC